MHNPIVLFVGTYVSGARCVCFSCVCVCVCVSARVSVSVCL